ncbi:MAG: TonB-dependent receptor plug domain-containing protein [Gammaproteobacteria bacterium]|jgi:iron complex outermembrane recepter protein
MPSAKPRYQKKKYLSIVLVPFLLSALPAAYAQEGGAADEASSEEAVRLDSVEVTGTRIRRVDTSTNSPTASVEAQELTLTGSVNVEDVLRDLPQTLPGVTSAVNNGNPGVATVNLRGLGEARTLILIDGKRFVGYDSGGVVDLNNIPSPLIERIDVVTGGASAVYGSDAMAGVVNFVLKRNFSGVELNSTYGVTDEADGRSRDFGVTFGGNFDSGRGNAVVHFGFTNRDEVLQGDRPFSEFSIATATGRRSGSLTDTNGNLFIGDQTTPGGPFYSFTPTGDLVPTGARRFNFNPFNLYQVPQERTQATALLRFDVDESSELYSRFSFANSNVKAVLAPSGTFFDEFDIPIANPFLSEQARNFLCDRDNNGTPESCDADNNGIRDADAVVTLPFGRRTIEVGTRDQFNDAVAYQGVLGLRGLFSNGWGYDVSAQHSRTELSRIFRNDISAARVNQSLDAIDAGGGNIVCRDPSGGCVAGNFFGDGNLSPEAAAFISLQLNEEIYTEQNILSGSLNGDLFFDFLRAGPMSVAVGAEYRDEQSASFPDQNYQTPGASPGFGSTVSVQNNYDVSEVFGEFYLPLVSDMPFVHKLSLEGGLRLSDYSTAGNVTTYKFGGEWAPVEDMRFRTLYQRAVRAPNIFEFGSPIQPGIGNADADPCAGNVADPDLDALCVATGVPQNVADNNGVPDVIAGQLNIFVGGNPNLEVEKSNTYTLGWVYEPSWSPDFTVQLDYYNIEIDDAIASLAENDILAGCYSAELNPGRDPGNEFCQLVKRNTVTGGLIGNPAFGLVLTAQNIAFIETSGIDLQLNYRSTLAGLGRIDAAFLGTYVMKNDDKPSAIAPTNECAGKYGTTCGAPDPKVRFNQRTTWTVDNYSLSYRWRYLAGVEADDPSTYLPAFAKIGGINYFDLAAEWKANDRVKMTFGIENLLDRTPPIVGSEAGPTDQNSGNTFPGVYDALGRAYFVGFNMKL